MLQTKMGRERERCRDKACACMPLAVKCLVCCWVCRRESLCTGFRNALHWRPSRCVVGTLRSWDFVVRSSKNRMFKQTTLSTDLALRLRVWPILFTRGALHPRQVFGVLACCLWPPASFRSSTLLGYHFCIIFAVFSNTPCFWQVTRTPSAKSTIVSTQKKRNPKNVADINAHMNSHV